MLRTPNRALWAILRPIVRLILRIRLNVTAPLLRMQGPFVLLANHASWYDPLLAVCSVAQPLCFAGADRAPRRGFLLGLARSLQLDETLSVSEALRLAAEEKSCVGLFPEGQRCADGVTGPIPADLAGQILQSGLGLVTLRISGAYFTAPRWADFIPRRGRIRVRAMRTLSPGVLQAMGAEELQSLIEQDLHEDASATARKRPAAFRGERTAEHLERLLYVCPKCGFIGTLESEENQLRCRKCGFATTYTLSGGLRGGGVPFENLRQWSLWQTDRLKLRIENSGEEAILEDDNVELYSLREGGAELVGRGGLHLYRDRLELPTGVAIPVEDIVRLQAAGGSGLRLESRRGSRFELDSVLPLCAGKYITAWKILKETKDKERSEQA